MSSPDFPTLFEKNLQRDGSTKTKGPRSMARLWAVKALFQNDQVHTPAPLLIEELHQFWIHDEWEDGVYRPLDTSFFEALVQVTLLHKTSIDENLKLFLPEGWTWDRFNPVIRSVLRVGCGEGLLENPPPVHVLINEYVDISAAFLDSSGTGLVNRILDQALKAKHP